MERLDLILNNAAKFLSILDENKSAGLPQASPIVVVTVEGLTTSGRSGVALSWIVAETDGRQRRGRSLRGEAEGEGGRVVNVSERRVIEDVVARLRGANCSDEVRAALTAPNTERYLESWVISALELLVREPRKLKDLQLAVALVGFPRRRTPVAKKPRSR